MSRRDGMEAGFTLIEMLVALAVFSIAALALLRLNGFALSTTVDLDTRALAQIVVENEAALALTDPPPVVRGTSQRTVENGGQMFSVSRTVTPTADLRLVRIDLLAVAPESGRRAALTIVKRVA
jgi:general secretion pathway protein I